MRDWLDVRLEAVEDHDRVNSPQVSTPTGAGQYMITPAHVGSIPLRLRLAARARGSEGPQAAGPQPPSPAGILIEAEVQGRVFSRTIPVIVQSPADAFRIILGDEDQDQGGARKVLKLRPLPGRQRVPLRVRNPTAFARDVIIELRRGPADSGPVMATPRMTIPAFAMQPVAFTASAPRNGAGESGPAAGPSATPASSPGSGPTPGEQAGRRLPNWRVF